ncbi:MAG: glycosyltransferase [Verrucomicrobia bacterium]|nr:glycosyltransferase [Verrucomicrobiota bacterium]
MKPFAIVIPWFGRDLRGGAEMHAWQIASRLAARGRVVEVLTTCCRAAQDDWNVNHLPEGVTREPEGFSVRRFRVDKKRGKVLGRVGSRLGSLPKTALKPGVSPVDAADTAAFCRDFMKSRALLRHVARNADSYHSFLFIPYLYGPIINGVPLVADKAWLLPCLHDEAYAYLPQVAAMFHQARGILFLSEGEFEVAVRLYGPGIVPKSVVVGGGVEIPDAAAVAVSARRAFPFGGDPYLLCVGRKCPGKNTPLIVEAFQAFKKSHPGSKLKLVLAGPGSADLNGLDGQVFDLGVVTEGDKLALLDGCRALLQPSENESFSRVIREAWFRAKPVVVHRDCLATATTVRSCNGGWLAAAVVEWSEVFGKLDQMPPAALEAKGAAGQRYARDMADWNHVMDRYEAVLFAPSTDSSGSPRRRSLPAKQAIHQILPALAYGDAISNHARWIRRQLQQMGFESVILAHHVDPRVAAECRVFSPECIKATDGVIYHHSIGSEVTPHVVAHPGPKCLIYHNITPAEFYELFRPEIARLLRQGREALRLLADNFPISVGDSEYNASELREAGFAAPGILPICVDPSLWNLPPDARLMDRLQRGQTNLLFVGRLSPSKKQDDLLLAFKAYLDLDPKAELHLVGSGGENDPYVAYLRYVARTLGLRERVDFAGLVNEAQLAAYYRTARLFWSMSEHEGFCVPLVEAMWHDVPVFAYKSSAVAETLGAGALLFTQKENVSEVAAAAWFLAEDAALRAKVIAAQRQRRLFCSPAAVAVELKQLVTRVLAPSS